MFNQRALFPVFISLIFLFIPNLINAQSANTTFHPTSEPSIFKNDEGATIEYLGLQTWTAKAVQDSLKSLAPNLPVHACMAVLKKNLGFAESRVMSYFDPESQSMYTVVTLVEDKARTEPLYLPEKEEPLINKWMGNQDLNDLKNQSSLLNGLQFFQKENKTLVLDDKLKSSSFLSEEQVQFLTQFHQHITNFNSTEDRNLAIQTLKEDGNLVNRMLASIVLLNFDSSREDIYTMLNQMRSENDRLSGVSATVLKIMTQNKQQVDWSEAIETIRALLAGTSLPNFATTLEILTNTQISPSLASSILTNNSFLLKEHLRAKHEKTTSVALAFVNQISRNQLNDPKAALDWLTQF